MVCQTSSITRIRTRRVFQGAVIPLEGYGWMILEGPKKLSMYKKCNPKHDVGFPTIEKIELKLAKGPRVLIWFPPPPRKYLVYLMRMT